MSTPKADLTLEEKTGKTVIDQEYSVFRLLIGMAAVLSPPAYPVEDPQKRKRETSLASFGSPERAHKFDDVLCALEILEEDEETEIVGWAKA
ncbi:hypothetical protein MMC16_007686 [Acarospora aff. strigata]|nr:hypothetical protein [Acarospora aff. strigata]